MSRSISDQNLLIREITRKIINAVNCKRHATEEDKFYRRPRNNSHLKFGKLYLFYLQIILEKVFHPQVKEKRKNHVNIIMKQCRFLFLVSYFVEVLKFKAGLELYSSPQILNHFNQIGYTIKIDCEYLSTWCI